MYLRLYLSYTYEYCILSVILSEDLGGFGFGFGFLGRCERKQSLDWMPIQIVSCINPICLGYVKCCAGDLVSRGKLFSSARGVSRVSPCLR